MNVASLTLLFLLLSTITGLAQGNLPDANANAKKIASNFVRKEKVPGMSITVSINDSIVFSEGFGFADLENKIAVLPGKTKFRMASITKTMTAATVARLSELGKIDIRKTPQHYLDSLKKKQYDFTIEEVGGHLSGIRRTPTTERLACENPYRRSDFYRIFNWEDLLFEPSTQMEYSNYGYKLLGVLIEEVTGEDIRSNHKRFILDVLGMKNTVPETRAADISKSKFYISKNNRLQEDDCLDCTFKYASGCYLSTSEDLATLGNAYLYPDRILTKESLASLVKSKKLKNGPRTNYGFGFDNYSDRNGNYYYGHSGGYYSARSCLRIYPKHKLVISVLLNRRVMDVDKLVAMVADNYIRSLEK